MGFLEAEESTGESLSTLILKRLEELSIPFEDCRGQSYDNGANMKGKIKGVQARLLGRKPKDFICAMWNRYSESSLQMPLAALATCRRCSHSFLLLLSDGPCDHNPEILVRYKMRESSQQCRGCEIPECRSQRCTYRGEGQKQCETP